MGGDAVTAGPMPLPEKGPGIAWTGLIGGVMGFAVLIAIAVLVAAGAGDNSPLWALPLIGLALLFVPAIVVSARPVASRKRVLRLVVIAALVLAAAGTPVYGLELPFVLAPAIGLLAQAAGFIFQGR